MFDTHRDVEIRFQNLIMSKSGEERLRMGCSMFDTAKKIVQSALASQRPGITAQEMKEETFLRFYGLDFSQTEKEKILSVLTSQ